MDMLAWGIGASLLVVILVGCGMWGWVAHAVHMSPQNAAAWAEGYRAAVIESVALWFTTQPEPLATPEFRWMIDTQYHNLPRAVQTGMSLQAFDNAVWIAIRDKRSPLSNDALP